jgi:ribosome-associated translation inhibitor RaiA
MNKDKILLNNSYQYSSIPIRGFNFPDASRFEKGVPKSKIYTYSRVSASLKKSFINDVDKIIWSYKLSPETLNLPAKGGVDEIQIFTLILKNENLKNDVLAAIDKAIPSPIIFILRYENKIRYTAAYKRPSEADKNKWVISDYFGPTDYIDENRLEKQDLPVVLNMKALYEAILKSLIPLKAKPEETLPMLVERIERLKKLEREIIKLESRIKKEKQFKNKVELNVHLRKLKEEINTLVD